MKTKITRRVLGGATVVFGLYWLWGTIVQPFFSASGMEKEELSGIFRIMIMIMILPLMAGPGILAVVFGFRLFRNETVINVKAVVGNFCVIGVIFLAASLKVNLPDIFLETYERDAFMLIATVVGGAVYLFSTSFFLRCLNLGVQFKELKVCYEAGPTGFVLARRLRKLGLDCVVMSPSKTERKPNEKIKTDKKDAQNIAKLFRNGDITEVRVPPATDEAVRDVCRARTDASDDLSRAKQRLNAFLLRNGYRYSGKSCWTPGHMRYLRDLTLADPAQKIVLEEPERSGDRQPGGLPAGWPKAINTCKPSILALIGCKDLLKK